MLIRLNGITPDTELRFLNLNVNIVSLVFSLYANTLIIVKKINVDFNFIDANLLQFLGELPVNIIGQQTFKSRPIVFLQLQDVYVFYPFLSSA